MPAEIFDPVDFDALSEGDRVRFVTANNGYGGTGQIWRTGVVKSVGARTITVDCDPNRIKPTAVLRRSAWRERAVGRNTTVKKES
jgi:hypothetical protein